MIINVTVDEGNYFHKLLVLLNNIPPFSKLRPRELELYSYILSYCHSHSRAPLQDINVGVFSGAFRQQVAEYMGIEVAGVYNLMKGLRREGVVEKDKLVPKYIIPKIELLTFKFINTE